MKPCSLTLAFGPLGASSVNVSTAVRIIYSFSDSPYRGAGPNRSAALTFPKAASVNDYIHIYEGTFTKENLFTAFQLKQFVTYAGARV